MQKSKNSKSSQAIFILFVLFQSFTYGIGNPLTKVAYESITPFWLLATRFLLSFLIVVPLFGKKIWAQVKSVHWSVWLPSCLCCASAYISSNVALDLATATTVGFLMSLPVLFVPFLTVLVLRRPYDYKRLPVQALMIIGLFFLCSNGGSFSFGLGELLALTDALCIAGMLVFGERAMANMDVLTLTALQITVTMVCCCACAFLFDDIAVLPTVTGTAWMVVLYLTLICTIAAYLMQNVAVAHLSATTVSMLQCTQPIMTAIISYFMLHETLSSAGLAGAAIIVVCLLADSWVTR